MKILLIFPCSFTSLCPWQVYHGNRRLVVLCGNIIIPMYFLGKKNRVKKAEKMKCHVG